MKFPHSDIKKMFIIQKKKIQIQNFFREQGEFFFIIDLLNFIDYFYL